MGLNITLVQGPGTLCKFRVHLTHIDIMEAQKPSLLLLKSTINKEELPAFYMTTTQNPATQPVQS